MLRYFVTFNGFLVQMLMLTNSVLLA